MNVYGSIVDLLDEDWSTLRKDSVEGIWQIGMMMVIHAVSVCFPLLVCENGEIGTIDRDPDQGREAREHASQCTK